MLQGMVIGDKNIIAGPAPGFVNGASLGPADDADVMESMDALFEQGIRTIISLDDEAISDEASKYWCELDDDCQHITDYEYSGAHYEAAILDSDAPTIDQMDALTDLLDNVCSKEPRVYIHCLAGLGRTGTVLAAYYMLRTGDYSHESASRFVRESHSEHAIESEAQTGFLKLYGKYLQECFAPGSDCKDEDERSIGVDGSSPTAWMALSQGPCMRRDAFDCCA